MARSISKSGIALIQKWEGLYLKAYRDPVGVLTIGYGTITNRKLGIVVQPGMKITREKAVEWMHKELDQIAGWLSADVKNRLNQHQFDAVLSFIYNVGIGNFRRSTLRKRILAGRYDAAADEFGRWVWARDRRTGRNVKLRGLVNRRADEAKMFRGIGIAKQPESPPSVVAKDDMVPAKKPVKDIAEDLAHKPEAGGAIAALGGALAVLAQQAQAAIANPWIAFAAGVVTAGSAIALYLYWRDSDAS